MLTSIYRSLAVPHFRFGDVFVISKTYFDAPITSATHVHSVLGLSAGEGLLYFPWQSPHRAAQ